LLTLLYKERVIGMLELEQLKLDIEAIKDDLDEMGASL